LPAVADDVNAEGDEDGIGADYGNEQRNRF
jgi:hypothetical protein